jgi:hypothetical protein
VEVVDGIVFSARQRRSSRRDGAARRSCRILGERGLFTGGQCTGRNLGETVGPSRRDGDNHLALGGGAGGHAAVQVRVSRGFA